MALASTCTLAKHSKRLNPSLAPISVLAHRVVAARALLGESWEFSFPLWAECGLLATNKARRTMPTTTVHFAGVLPWEHVNNVRDPR